MERCKFAECKRKAYSAMTCKCGNVYCSLHKPDTAHSCSYDYRTEHQRTLSNQNPRVVASRLPDMIVSNSPN